MAVWRQNVALMLFCVTFFGVGNGRIIVTTTEGTKSTTLTPNSTFTSILANTTMMALNGTVSTSVKETKTVFINTTSSENTTMQINGTKNENTTMLINGTKNVNITPPINKTDILGNKVLDLAFIMDTTGSMGSYIDSARNNIRNLVDEIAVNSNTDLRVALIEYRDHPPQERSFVTRTNDFTKSVKTMKTWLDEAKAQGGGDGPEAVAEGLFDVTNLSWREEAAKITVLISDAPPHGLAPWKDRSFKEGSPNGHDPMKIAQNLSKSEVIVYAVGCEPAIDPYKDFFMALAYITGGQYIPLSDPTGLIQAIVGGAREELSLQKFSNYVEKEINRTAESGTVVDEESIARYVYEKLKQQGATSQKLLRNNKPLEGASRLAKTFAASATMADVSMAYASEHPAPSILDRRRISTSDLRSKSVSTSYGMMEAKAFPPMEEMYSAEHISIPVASSSADFAGSVPLHSGPMSSSIGASHSTSGGTDSGESYSTVDSAVSYEQIARLVRKKTAKLSTP